MIANYKDIIYAPTQYARVTRLSRFSCESLLRVLGTGRSHAGRAELADEENLCKYTQVSSDGVHSPVT